MHDHLSLDELLDLQTRIKQRIAELAELRHLASPAEVIELRQRRAELRSIQRNVSLAIVQLPLI